MLQIVPVESRAQRRAFIDFPWRIYRDLPAWVPPLRSDVARLIDPRRGDFFHHPGNAAAFWMARREGETVGRIAAFHNSAHLAVHPDGAGFAGFFECIDDAAVAQALLGQAETWLRGRGLKVIRGPANFNIQEEAGVLLDGFEHAPMAGMAYTPPYYRNLFESAGYRKAKDVYVYRATPATARMSRLDRISFSAERRAGLAVRNLDMKNLDREAEALAAVFSAAWSKNWGMVPISAKEFQEAYERYRLFVLPELVYIAEVDGKPAGAFVAMPDINTLIKKIDGKLFPFGWWKLLRGRKTVTRYRVFLMGVVPEYRRLGIPLIFLKRVTEQLVGRGYTEVEFSWILEDNREIISVIEKVGAYRAQTLRFYEKALE